jgi:hypothetical protein
MLKKLPNQIYLYTFAVTSQAFTMTDGDGAQILTVVKQGLINVNKVAPARLYGQIAATVRGCPRNIFVAPGKPIIKGIVSSLILLAAYNMVIYHIGSEKL